MARYYAANIHIGFGGTGSITSGPGSSGSGPGRGFGGSGSGSGFGGWGSSLSLRSLSTASVLQLSCHPSSSTISAAPGRASIRTRSKRRSGRYKEHSGPRAGPFPCTVWNKVIPDLGRAGQQPGGCRAGKDRKRWMVQLLEFGTNRLRQTRSCSDDKLPRVAGIGKNGQALSYLPAVRSCAGTS